MNVHQNGTQHPAFLVRGPSVHGNVTLASLTAKRTSRDTSAELDPPVQTQGCERMQSSQNRAVGERLSPRWQEESGTKAWAWPAMLRRWQSPGRYQWQWEGRGATSSLLTLHRKEQGPLGLFDRCAG